MFNLARQAESLVIYLTNGRIAGQVRESSEEITHVLSKGLQERSERPAAFSRGPAMRIVTAVTRPMISAWEGYRTSLTRVRDSGKGKSSRLPFLSSHQEQAYSSRSSTK